MARIRTCEARRSARRWSARSAQAMTHHAADRSHPYWEHTSCAIARAVAADHNPSTQELVKPDRASSARWPSSAATARNLGLACRLAHRTRLLQHLRARWHLPYPHRPRRSRARGHLPRRAPPSSKFHRLLSYLGHHARLPSTSPIPFHRRHLPTSSLPFPVATWTRGLRARRGG